MASPTNTLVAVQTYQDSMLGALSNYGAFISTANKRENNFQNLPDQLGATVLLKLPYRFTTNNSTVVSWQGIEQRQHSLTVDQEISAGVEMDSLEFIYNLENDRERLIRGMAEEVGAQVESNLALNAISGPYRFYGDGVTPFTSKFQLSSAMTQFLNSGMPKGMLKGYITDTCVDSIVANDLAQFVTGRNESEANSWELTDFARTKWYRSNLLPVHTAGTEGAQASTLTVVSTTTNSDGAVTAITFSGCNAASDADSVKQHDKFRFNDGVAGYSNMRALTWVGHKVSANPVQFRATADAASTGGSQVTVSVYPPLQATAGRNQNINQAIVAGMQCSVLPDHRAGLITADDPLFCALPQMPSTDPFPSSSVRDPDTGLTIRTYFGEQFGLDKRGLVVDQRWGSTLVPEYSMTIVFPV